MSFLNKKMTWTNAEFIPLKVCIAAAYLYIGSTFSEFFLSYKGFILGLFAVSLVYVMILWMKKMQY
ncbi:MAG: hypothetical protein KA736_10820 [Crocinitomicaceae bacterium]|nr:hypothetical protein [Crocinitomicaceae bacterium]MBP6033474.1 hypothetical protein [Crocinitomicaceae bacterium]